MNFKPHPKAEDRKQSAFALIKLLLQNRNSQILPEHLRELLDKMLWKITEADGKYTTRHQSAGALECREKKLLRHEHVYPKEKMIDALLRAEPNEVDQILAVAIGCTVTMDEHSRLTVLDDVHYGWSRYREAGIVVMDTAMHPPIPLNFDQLIT